MAGQLTKITPARGRTTVVSENLGQGINYKQLSQTACEVSWAKLTAGGTAAAARLVDSANIQAEILGGGYAFEKGILLSCESSGSDQLSPTQPIPFKKGLAVVFEQGEPGNAEVSLTVN